MLPTRPPTRFSLQLTVPESTLTFSTLPLLVIRPTTVPTSSAPLILTLSKFKFFMVPPLSSPIRPTLFVPVIDILEIVYPFPSKLPVNSGTGSQSLFNSISFKTITVLPLDSFKASFRFL